ncbi:MAG: type III-A CRISPR-associated RAMP protein Csm4 [Lachnospiraceae bacterium]|nr:type III-A CRISPR-associated RAMP protein Csm4 [Lachnospiraceae bacterium]
MKYRGYQLDFLTAVHIGRGHLEDAESFLTADTLFSALCIEALSAGAEKLEELVRCARTAQLRLSDAFPYHGKVFYIPKPLAAIDTGEEGSSVVKKKARKLEYIPADKVSDYLAGKLDVVTEYEALREMGQEEVRTKVQTRETEDNVPYTVGTYSFSADWGLYVIVGYESAEALSLAEDLLKRLSYSGIGGRRSSGLGRFELRSAELSESFTGKLTVDADRSSGSFLLLASSLPDGDLEDGCRGARYRLIRRSGFVYSETFAAQPVRKKDGYLFRSGSVFTRTYAGKLEDAGIDGSHSVYRYAYPVFMEVLR